MARGVKICWRNWSGLPFSHACEPVPPAPLIPNDVKMPARSEANPASGIRTPPDLCDARVERAQQGMAFSTDQLVLLWTAFPFRNCLYSIFA